MRRIGDAHGVKNITASLSGLFIGSARSQGSGRMFLWGLSRTRSRARLPFQGVVLVPKCLLYADREHTQALRLFAAAFVGALLANTVPGITRSLSKGAGDREKKLSTAAFVLTVLYSFSVVFLCVKYSGVISRALPPGLDLDDAIAFSLYILSYCLERLRG